MKPTGKRFTTADKLRIMKLMETVVETDPNTADINFTVLKGKFRDVLKTEARHQRGTMYRMRKVNKNDSVRIAGRKRTRLVIVGGKAVQIRIRILSDDKQEQYFPLGITFVRRKDGVGDNGQFDALGRKNFSFGRMHLYGRSLYITDNFLDCGNNDRYKFSIIIQRAKDGAIGIIDPGIDHTN